VTRLGVGVIAVLMVGGCVPSHSTMFGPVDRDLERRLGLDVAWQTDVDPRVPEAVAALLDEPLDVDAALRIAMAQNRHLRAAFAELGVAAAGLAEATVLPPTEVDIDHKFGISGDGSETEIEVVQDVLELLQIGQRRGVARSEIAAARARATAAAVDLAMDVEVAFYDVVAAQQELELRQTAFDAASAAAELTERMHAAGNTTDLALVRDRDQREQARVDLARAEVAVVEEREALNAALGLSGEDTSWTVATRLPEVPRDAPALDDLEQDAVAQSLDLVALRADAETAAGMVGLARLRAVLPGVGAGVAASRRDGGDWEVGPVLQVSLPIFDQQQGPRAKANAELRRTRHEITGTAVDLRAAARAARAVALEAHDEAVHIKDVILPLRNEILDQLVRQYNAMNASTFELLEAKRDLVDAGSQYIDALRRYWKATARVKALRRGVLPEEAP
jgi:cobalt-zinc-cadmium efflux system outer membrane protein